jgi:hypothetical protein
VEVGGNVVASYLYGDGSNITGISSNLDQIVNIGNVTSNTVQFSNATTGLVTTANVEVGGELTVSGNVAVDTDTLFVDSVNDRVGIGTVSPIASLDIDGGPENDTVPALSIRGGLYDTSDLYVLNTYNVNTGAGYAAKVIGVNIKNKVETDNTVQLRNNVGGLTSAGAIYLGSDNTNQGVFGVLTCQGSAGTTLTEKFTITDSGNVGIGTTTPHAKLQVNGASGSVSTTAGDITRYIYFINSGLNGGSGFVNNFGAVSIYASDDIVSSGSLVTTTRAVYASDERIKRDIVDVQDDEALQLLRLIEPKKYKYKDTFKNGDDEVYGFIAQQISNVFPDATQVRTSYIPNIYETANVASKTITFPTFNTADLESNTFTLRVMDGENNEHDITITEVIDEHSVLVEEDLTNLCGYVDENGDLVEQNRLFAWGQKVDDFIYLKKDSIWTVATTALQEVDRQLQAEKEKVRVIDNQLQAERAKVTTLETQLASVLTRLDALENA